jgi:hypothetical protein
MFVRAGNCVVRAADVYYVEFEGKPGAGVCGWGSGTAAVVRLRGGESLQIYDPAAADALRAALLEREAS